MQASVERTVFVRLLRHGLLFKMPDVDWDESENGIERGGYSLWKEDGRQRGRRGASNLNDLKEVITSDTSHAESLIFATINR